MSKDQWIAAHEAALESYHETADYEQFQAELSDLGFTSHEIHDQARDIARDNGLWLGSCDVCDTDNTWVTLDQSQAVDFHVCEACKAKEGLE